MEDATIVSGTESLNRSGSSQGPVTARNLGLSRSGRRGEAKAFGAGSAWSAACRLEVPDISINE
jgi:hypothetical protein